jgi:ectoine hydroxylase-related dioxygenase (phytanoyl-CoA dioxygenase family)
MIINASEQQTFANMGLIRVEGLIPDSVVSPARELVYGRLAKAGLWHEDSWIGLDDETQGHKPKQALKDIGKSQVFKSLLTPEVLDVAQQLVGGEAIRLWMPLTQLLFTPPNATEWVVPYSSWHLDVPRLGPLGAPGVQMFTFVDTVAPGGGGTLIVAGSHRLLNDMGVIRSQELKKRLKQYAYFRDLMDKRVPDRSRFMTETHYIDDVPLQVTELTGAPGDVFFTDLRLLHTIAWNASPKPRLMVTQRFPREAVADQMYA